MTGKDKTTVSLIIATAVIIILLLTSTGCSPIETPSASPTQASAPSTEVKYNETITNEDFTATCAGYANWVGSSYELLKANSYTDVNPAYVTFYISPIVKVDGSYTVTFNPYNTYVSNSYGQPATIEQFHQAEKDALAKIGDQRFLRVTYMMAFKENGERIRYNFICQTN